MAREFAISMYLLFFKLLFNLCKISPQKKKTVCVASFGDNIFYTTRALAQESSEKIYILKDSKCTYPFNPAMATVIAFHWRRPLSYLRGVYHLATATTILVDNYFGFLAVTNFKSGTTCIQLWHAAGALKQFGLMDPSVKHRPRKAKERFQKVYDRFDYVVTGSDKMATIFQESFGIPSHSIIRTGFPRTDFFYDQNEKQQICKLIKQQYPILSQKKVILYAPTFRDKQLTDYQIKLDFDLLFTHLSDEYVLFIKNHPAVTYTFKEKYDEFVYDVSDYYDVNHLLLITEVLITDYSSIPCEFALLERPMIFYMYDLPEYQRERGLINEGELPGPIAMDTKSIIDYIQENSFDVDTIRHFAKAWNEYSIGISSKNVCNTILSLRDEGKMKEIG